MRSVDGFEGTRGLSTKWVLQGGTLVLMATALVAACKRSPEPKPERNPIAVSPAAPPPAPPPPLPTPSLEGYRLSQVTPPAFRREFRGSWIATVGNINWPSRAGLPVDLQKGELLALFDRAVELKLNAVILQVRPSADAFYASALEPWSSYLTGEMGKAPEPYYDPLEFAIVEAHRRGLELHAWFNPFRALSSIKQSGSASPQHISKRRPDLVRTYGDLLWLDPGEPDARAAATDAILDVARRYDVDGVHIDDYFYPYQLKRAGKILDFPDDLSWKRYQAGGGALARDDWRRDNVNGFVRELYSKLKAERPAVKFGISPFGIWRPMKERNIAGLDAYAEIYADSRTWLQNGWVDYIAPQLYWDIASKHQSYPTLLDWWVENNTQNRHLWPGIATDRIGPTRPAEEIANQILLTRGKTGAAPGNIHWSFGALAANRGNVIDNLMHDVYAEPALMPAYPWLSRAVPAQPVLRVVSGAISWQACAGETPAWWAVQVCTGTQWQARVLPGSARELPAGELPEVFSVMAVDRFGNTSPAVVIERIPGLVRETL